MVLASVLCLFTKCVCVCVCFFPYPISGTFSAPKDILHQIRRSVADVQKRAMYHIPAIYVVAFFLSQAWAICKNTPVP